MRVTANERENETERAAKTETERASEGETERGRDRASVVVRPGVFITVVIASAFAAGLVIFWLLRSMHI